MLETTGSNRFACSYRLRLGINQSTVYPINYH